MRNKRKEKLTKTTVILPEILLKDAQDVTGVGITQTLRLALEFLAAKKSYERLFSLIGTHKFSIDLEKLRED